MTQDPTELASLVSLLDHAWQGGFTTKSDLAREQAPVVSMATERGLITTRVGRDDYANKHFITPEGLRTLWALKGLS